ncbi:MAG: proline--tRNA ligase [Nanoarchaeota archaeon]|nr:proline--tRNA ligase [Nanoarchaeota archaeon]
MLWLALVSFNKLVYLGSVMVSKKKDTKGITAEKDEFSEWFTQIMLKADLADYTDVSGMIVFRPTAYAIWEKVKEECDKRFKKLGIKNCYFPLFIPEKTFAKLQKHTEDFAPEVAWITYGGNTKLNERLAVRPTSETIMYESYAKWIRSHRDLPLKLNQWNNVVRWEFKHPVPFLRTREFLWNEGHTAYATKEEALAEEDEIIHVYKTVCEDFLALPALIGRKSRKETFPGAEFTTSMEYYMPNGKAVQGPDFHFDGQHYSKAYGIKFLDKEGKEDFAWQNTFAISTRMLGVMFAVHSDEHGLVMPPRVAPNKVAIVPIIFEDSAKKVLKEAKGIAKSLKEFEPILDDRDYKPGFKFNEWELKGVPIRIEIGPKDVDAGKCVLVRRDTGKKEVVNLDDLKSRVSEVLEEIQEGLFKRAEKMLKNAVVKADNMKDLKEGISERKIVFTGLCGDEGCEENLKAESGGAKVLNVPSEGIGKKGKCVLCGSEAKYWGYVGKSY